MTSISAILVTESLKESLLSLQPIFKQIKNIFGHFPGDSVVVLGTKKNECSEVLLNKKTDKIKNVMR